MLFMVTAAMAQKVQPADIIGVWETPAKTFKFEMFKEGNEYKAHMLFGNKTGGKRWQNI